VEDLVASLPPYLKYVVLTVVPWIELRGSVPWAVQQGDRLYMPIILLANIAVFFPTYFILQWVYQHIPEGSWLRRKLEHARDRARPLVDKYGLLGLTIFVAVPLPGTGAYAGSAAAWLLDIEWHRAFAGVAIGVTIAWGIVWAVSEAVARGISLF